MKKVLTRKELEKIDGGSLKSLVVRKPRIGLPTPVKPKMEVM